MGPGFRNKVEGYKSIKPGEVPVFNDSTNPCFHRRLLIDWIAYQELASDDDKKLSFGQQLFTVITNVRGNAGQRLNAIRSNISSTLTRDQFIELVEQILDIIDPEDREASFLETAKTWRDLMKKRHMSGQSFDQYWTEYSTLVFKYAQAHGNVAVSAGVQELLALNCIIHADFPRSEFGVVLDHAMRFQRDHKNGTKTFGTSLTGGQVVLPRGVRETFSQLSSLNVDEESSNHPSSTVTGGLRGVSGVAGTSTDTTPLAVTLREATDNFDNIKEMFASLDDILGDAAGLLSGDRDATDGETVDAKLGDGRTVLEKIKEILPKVSTSMSATLASSSSAGNDRGVTTKLQVDDVPMLSMEAVRVALRRIDSGQQAISAGTSQNAGPKRSQTTYLAQSSTSPGSKPKKCWVCGDEHFAKENEPCRKALQARRQEKRDAKRNNGSAENSETPKEGDYLDSGTAEGRTKSRSAMFWANPPDSIYTTMTNTRMGTTSLPLRGAE